MYAMLLEKVGAELKYVNLPKPSPGKNEILIKVIACGICRTDLHVLDGDLKNPRLPLILGHQIVGIIELVGDLVTTFSIGQQVGVAWLGGSCQRCNFCLMGKENLCDQASFTGYQLNGGLAEYCIADPNFCFPIPQGYPPEQAAPLLCAGLIGYRALLKTGAAKNLGIYGFGAAAHIIIQVALNQARNVYAFTSPHDFVAQDFAYQLGAIWAGDSLEKPPEPLDASIIFAPVGSLVPAALGSTIKGGIVVCAGIHMSEIPSFPYALLWGERTLCSVANLTRKDGEEFLALAPTIPIHTKVNIYSLKEANYALADLRLGKFTGSAVIDLRQS